MQMESKFDVYIAFSVNSRLFASGRCQSDTFFILLCFGSFLYQVIVEFLATPALQCQTAFDVAPADDSEFHRSLVGGSYLSPQSSVYFNFLFLMMDKRSKLVPYPTLWCHSFSMTYLITPLALSCHLSLAVGSNEFQCFQVSLALVDPKIFSFRLSWI